MDVAFGQRTLKQEQLRAFGHDLFVEEQLRDFADTDSTPSPRRHFWRDDIAMLAACIHTLFYMVAPWLFEPSRRAVRRFAAEKTGRGFPPPRHGECARCATASPWLYLARVRSTAESPFLRAAAAVELGRINHGGDIGWRHSRLWHFALAAMPFEE